MSQNKDEAKRAVENVKAMINAKIGVTLTPLDARLVSAHLDYAIEALDQVVEVKRIRRPKA